MFIGEKMCLPCVWWSENNIQELVLAFHVISEDWTAVVRLSSKFLSLPTEPSCWPKSPNFKGTRCFRQWVLWLSELQCSVALSLWAKPPLDLLPDLAAPEVATLELRVGFKSSYICLSPSAAIVFHCHWTWHPSYFQFLAGVSHLRDLCSLAL